jgi:hypothetical protein
MSSDAINTEVNETTGKSAYEMVFGRKPPSMPSQVNTSPHGALNNTSDFESLLQLSAPSLFQTTQWKSYSKRKMPSTIAAFLWVVDASIPISANVTQPFRSLSPMIQPSAADVVLQDFAASVPVAYCETNDVKVELEIASKIFSDGFVSFWGDVFSVNIFRVQQDEVRLVSARFDSLLPSVVLAEVNQGCEAWLDDGQPLSSSSPLLQVHFAKAVVLDILLMPPLLVGPAGQIRRLKQAERPQL